MMKNLYLNTKQILFFVLPLLFMSYLYTSSKTVVGYVDSVLELFYDDSSYEDRYKELTIDSIKNGYFKSIEKLQTNYSNFDQSLYEINKPLSQWVIAYSFKYVDVFYAKRDQKVKEQTPMMTKVSKLQKMVDKRNKNIQSNLNHSAKSDADEIWDLIKKRDLINPEKAKKKMVYLPIELSRYNLQMILLSQKKPKVIINNKIYNLYQNIDKDVKIISIRKNKILLKNKKEKRWLKLIK